MLPKNIFKSWLYQMKHNGSGVSSEKETVESLFLWFNCLIDLISVFSLSIPNGQGSFQNCMEMCITVSSSTPLIFIANPICFKQRCKALSISYFTYLEECPDFQSFHPKWNFWIDFQTVQPLIYYWEQHNRKQKSPWQLILITRPEAEKVKPKVWFKYSS